MCFRHRERTFTYNRLEVHHISRKNLFSNVRQSMECWQSLPWWAAMTVWTNTGEQQCSVEKHCGLAVWRRRTRNVLGTHLELTRNVLGAHSVAHWPILFVFRFFVSFLVQGKGNYEKMSVRHRERTFTYNRNIFTTQAQEFWQPPKCRKTQYQIYSWDALLA